MHAEHDRVGWSAFQASLVAPQSSSESKGVMQILVGACSEEARATNASPWLATRDCRVSRFAHVLFPASQVLGAWRKSRCR